MRLVDKHLRAVRRNLEDAERHLAGGYRVAARSALENAISHLDAQEARGGWSTSTPERAEADRLVMVLYEEVRRGR